MIISCHFCVFVLVVWDGAGWAIITFICMSRHTSRYATVRSLALPHIRLHATLLYVLLHFHTYFMLRCCTFSCVSTHKYTTLHSFALPQIRHATALLATPKCLGQFWPMLIQWVWRQTLQALRPALFLQKLKALLAEKWPNALQKICSLQNGSMELLQNYVKRKPNV